MPDATIDRWTLVDLVRRQAERYGEREFMRFDDGTTMSFAELDRQSTRLAHALAARGLRVGDRLLALLLNGPAPSMVLVPMPYIYGCDSSHSVLATRPRNSTQPLPWRAAASEASCPFSCAWRMARPIS